ncbi:MAG TPA: DUF2508 domain-containing protein [Ruminiclostridium sp.]|jgi:hypothetical protein|nr:YaaL family protein [Clostridiaceae bacterium]HAA25444.1 DUF2508 domain-containing protein [Ruminiclostridium sp.]
MDGNAAFRHTYIKGPGIFKKLSALKLFYDEDGQQEVYNESDCLLKCLKQAREDWLTAVENFDQAENDDMIDYYIYNMKACQIRYNYLLKRAKELGLRNDFYEAQ